MFFMDIYSSCSDPAVLVVLKIVKSILNLVQMIGPILAIVSLIYTIIMLIKNPDEKKYVKRIKNSLIALLLVFFVPVIVNTVLGALGETTKFSQCWNSVDNTSRTTAKYKEINSSKSTSQIVTDPSEYQKGTSKPTSSSSSSNNNSNNSSGSRRGSGNNKSNKTVFIGDSRTVQMYAYKTGTWSGANYSSGGVHEVGTDIYVAEGAQGLSWMKSTGIPAAKKYFVNGNAIVILMGVNDLSNADSYISYINGNASNWKSSGASLYFVSVNPCSGNYSKLNSSINTFNSKLKSGLNNNVGWIDTNSVLTKNGFKTTDGLHYDANTSNMIYDYIKNIV